MRAHHVPLALLLLVSWFSLAAAATPRMSRAKLAALRTRCDSPDGAPFSPRGLTVEERRGILYDCAKTMLPGGRNAGGYRESVITADLDIPVAR